MDTCSESFVDVENLLKRVSDLPKWLPRTNEKIWILANVISQHGKQIQGPFVVETNVVTVQLGEKFEDTTFGANFFYKKPLEDIHEVRFFSPCRTRGMKTDGYLWTSEPLDHPRIIMARVFKELIPGKLCEMIPR